MTPMQAVLKEAEDKMKKSMTLLAKQFSEVRGGRANPQMVEHITVSYYGAPTPLKQLAAITAPEPRMLMVQPWDPSLMPEIEKAILQSGLGITPLPDKQVVRLPVPPLTTERRNELMKLLHKMAEDGRVGVRNARRDLMESLKKLKSDQKWTEDDVHEAQNDVQKLTDKYVGDIDSQLKSKEQELQAV
jgi:ribosome recycling factor